MENQTWRVDQRSHLESRSLAADLFFVDFNGVRFVYYTNLDTSTIYQRVYGQIIDLTKERTNRIFAPSQILYELLDQNQLSYEQFQSRYTDELRYSFEYKRKYWINYMKFCNLVIRSSIDQHDYIDAKILAEILCKVQRSVKREAVSMDLIEK